MGFIQIILGVIFLIAALTIVLGEYFSLFILLAIVVGVILFIIRLFAMFYWYGKDKGEW